MLTLRNPHSVLAALRTRPKDVQEVRAFSDSNTAWADVLKLAKENKVRVTQPTPSKGPKGQDAGKDGRVGGSEALVKERTGLSLEELFANAERKAGGKGLWLALDSLQDPHNVGAIFRTAAFFGVQGILLTQERSAPITGTTYDVASGGMEYVPFAMQINLVRGMESAKQMGLWTLGTSEHAPESLDTVKRDRAWLLILGNEEQGIRRLTEENCDMLCKIPAQGEVGSLNVSVAAGIFMSHLSR